MGRPSIAEEIYDNESKINFGVPGSVRSLDDVTHNPALESSIQLFESDPSTKEQQRRIEVREWLVFICIVILAMMDSFNATVLIPALPDLANTFAEPLASTFWVNTVYLLFGASSQLYFAMMSEVFNHGPVWIIAVVLATIGTGICSGSMSLAELIVGRIIQGIGGGGAMSLCYVMMTGTASKAMHSRYSCYILLTRMCGGILGPVIGGLFLDNADWRWAFHFNFLFCALGLLAIPFAVDLRALKYIPMHKLRTLDWTGATMAFLGLAIILVGLSCVWEEIISVEDDGYDSSGVLSAWVCGVRSLAILSIVLHFCPLHVRHLVRYRLASHAWARDSASHSCWSYSRERVKMYPVDYLWWLGLDCHSGLGHGLLLTSYNVRIHNLPKDGDGSLSTLPTTMSYYTRAWVDSRVLS
ncbi:MFS multidrug transporter, putative [Penicillium digitatum]|uniref:MFS multidrug transporter, putative n=1 Tax=Penicillium digitatum TaxID=36651 RepID=A0A7T6XMY6_PENDI|nr:MFS multidrug transporter, putative [Penicillium digitatum]